MTDAELRVRMRQNELQNRISRRAGLLRQLENEGRLLYEELSPADIAATTVALARIQKQEIDYRRATEFPSYWKRLWYALLNKEFS